MGERLCPWRPKPPQVVLELLMGMPVMYLVHRVGPTSFIVREDGDELKKKVSIGARPCCSCMPTAPGQSCPELCRHLLFVMCKVLRVPPSNPLVWQLSLTDRELDEVLRCAVMPEAPAAPAADIKKPTKAGAGEEGSVKRRSVDQEDPCPICYEDMAVKDIDHLVWCRHGCGRNVHGRCMGVWAEHQTRALGKDLTCPLCRSAWGDFKWRPPPPKRRRPDEVHEQMAVAIHLGTSCGACRKAPLVGKRYRCLICADLDLCEGCFQGGHHPQHPFACKATPTAFAVPAQRPDMMPAATRITPLPNNPIANNSSNGNTGNIDNTNINISGTTNTDTGNNNTGGTIPTTTTGTSSSTSAMPAATSTSADEGASAVAGLAQAALPTTRQASMQVTVQASGQAGRQSSGTLSVQPGQAAGIGPHARRAMQAGPRAPRGQPLQPLTDVGMELTVTALSLSGVPAAASTVMPAVQTQQQLAGRTAPAPAAAAGKAPAGLLLAPARLRGLSPAAAAAAAAMARAAAAAAAASSTAERPIQDEQHPSSVDTATTSHRSSARPAMGDSRLRRGPVLPAPLPTPLTVTATAVTSLQQTPPQLTQLPSEVSLTQPMHRPCKDIVYGRNLCAGKLMRSRSASARRLPGTSGLCGGAEARGLPPLTGRVLLAPLETARLATVSEMGAVGMMTGPAAGTAGLTAGPAGTAVLIGAVGTPTWGNGTTSTGPAAALAGTVAGSAAGAGSAGTCTLASGRWRQSGIVDAPQTARATLALSLTSGHSFHQAAPQGLLQVTQGHALHQAAPTGLPQGLQTALYRHQRFTRTMSIPHRSSAPPQAPTPDVQLAAGVQGHTLLAGGDGVAGPDAPHSLPSQPPRHHNQQHQQQLMLGSTLNNAPARAHHVAGKAAPAAASFSVGGFSLAPKPCHDDNYFANFALGLSQHALQECIPATPSSIGEASFDGLSPTRLVGRESVSQGHWMPAHPNVMVRRPWSGASSSWLDEQSGWARLGLGLGSELGRRAGVRSESRADMGSVSVTPFSAYTNSELGFGPRQSPGLGWSSELGLELASELQSDSFRLGLGSGQSVRLVLLDNQRQDDGVVDENGSHVFHGRTNMGGLHAKGNWPRSQSAAVHRVEHKHVNHMLRSSASDAMVHSVPEPETVVVTGPCTKHVSEEGSAWLHGQDNGQACDVGVVWLHGEEPGLCAVHHVHVDHPHDDMDAHGDDLHRPGVHARCSGGGLHVPVGPSTSMEPLQGMTTGCPLAGTGPDSVNLGGPDRLSDKQSGANPSPNPLADGGQVADDASEAKQSTSGLDGTRQPCPVGNDVVGGKLASSMGDSSVTLGGGMDSGSNGGGDGVLMCSLEDASQTLEGGQGVAESTSTAGTQLARAWGTQASK